ncbi:L-tyrosine/L-tryptophan isonitrile synthase family protein [Nakamurella endophytica]|uniref:L-tyrosine/L-tryptophan isonitrile synthase family protein n=1 Tax=Nakamurella endophytica TaxID=1748367 RepID=UPI00166BE521|nr:L-tyrosine/L-tryptophan isonitrile synthase family protein [Nakamurella endophytica]
MPTTSTPTSPYIYVNAQLPTVWAPPVVTDRAELDPAELHGLLAGNDVTITPPSAGSVEERLLAVFTDPEVLFGDPDFIPAHTAEWIERFSRFTAVGEPIEFVTMAFPYKVPNPLKTDRRAPDLGEALMLRRFQAVLDAVGQVYRPGARLTILEEGILGRCQGVDPRRIAAYRVGIDAITELSGVDRDRVGFHSLDDMAELVPNFEARWIFEQERLRELWDTGDPVVRAAYATTNAAQRTSVPTWDYDPAVLARAYDPDQTGSELRYARDYIDKVSHRQFFAYRAALGLRDAGYLEQIAPGALKLTVSPKPENLAVVPVNRVSRVLPYHGVPVLFPDGRWEVRYLGGLGELGPVQALHLAADPDPAPIGYRVTG